jgi:Tfp pilus assembly protein PilF
MQCLMRSFTVLLSYWLLFTLSVSAQSRGAEDIEAGKTNEVNRVLALVVGISDYREIGKLNFAHKDARLIEKVLNLSFQGTEKKIQVLTDGQASERAIKQGIMDLYKEAREGDLVIFYFAGHGDVTRVVEEESGYFLAYDVTADREYDAGGAVPFQFVNKYISGMAQKCKVWMMTDACHSGVIINEKGARATLEQLSAGFTNTVKFISCQPHELSYEDPDLAQGVFTYFLTKGLGGMADKTEPLGRINVDELNTFLKQEVRTFTKQKQSPKVTFGGNEFDDIFLTEEKLLTLFPFSDFPQSTPTGGIAMRSAAGGGEKSPLLKEFENLVYSGKLYGSNTSAKYFLEQAAKKKTATAEELKLMENLLIDALLERAQRNTNLFLSGRPVVEKTEDFTTTSNDFLLAAQLLGSEHVMHAQLINRSRFFNAMRIVQANITDEMPLAEKTLQELKEAEPNAAYVNQGLAYFYLTQNRKKEAEEQLALAETKNTTWTKPKNTQVYLHILSGRLDQAQKLLAVSDSLSIKSKTDVRRLAVNLHTANLELKNAEDELLKIQENEPAFSKSEFYALKAKIDLLRGRISVAEDGYKKAIKEDGKNSEFLLALAGLYKEDKDTVKSLHYYRLVLKLDSLNETAQNAVYQLGGATPKSAEKEPDYYNIPAVISRARLYSSRSMHQEAVNLLKKSLETSDWNPVLHLELGRVYAAWSKNSEAETAWKKALALSPYDFESIKALTELYLSQKKNVEADALLQAHDRYFENSAKWQAFKFDVYRRIGGKKEILSLLEKSKQLDSLDTEVYKSLFRYHIDGDDYKKAKAEFDQLVDMGGRHKDSLEFITRVTDRVNLQLARGNYDKTIDGLKLVLDMDPFDLQSMFNLAQSAYMTRDYRLSMRLLNEYNKYLNFLTPDKQMKFYSLQGRVLLELGYYGEAEDVFKLANAKALRPSYLGLAMAQMEQGKIDMASNTFLRERSLNPIMAMRAEFLKEYSIDALKRMERLEKLVKR